MLISGCLNISSIVTLSTLDFVSSLSMFVKHWADVDYHVGAIGAVAQQMLVIISRSANLVE